jgi:glutaminase
LIRLMLKFDPMATTAKEKRNTRLNGTDRTDFNGMMEVEYSYLFECLRKNREDYIYLSDLVSTLQAVGIRENDPRLKLDQAELGNASQVVLDYEKFKYILKHSLGGLIKDAIQGNLVIPDFASFCREITAIYELTNKNKSGNVATYIPQLGRVDPGKYAISICTVSGQQFSIGDSNEDFCIQSICKPINYCMVLEEHGEDVVHQHVGREPSGIGFNGLVLNENNLPHNPMINAGAIMTCSLVKPELEMADRFEYVLNFWNKITGNQNALGFNNSVYLSEKETADRNFALGYYMREKGAFPENTNLLSTLEFYFQCCSIQTDTNAMAVAAATLANSGICPITNERAMENNTVKNCLSLMNSCGMYDFSGEFAFTIGLPAKSGVAGGLMLVIPNLMGIAIWSPKLDKSGNSVKGIEFSKELVKRYNFHSYDSLNLNNPDKKDPRLKRNEAKIDDAISLCWAAFEGNLLEVQHLYARGININMADYDGRTPLHLAASEGHEHIIAYLIDKGVNLNPRDRWGNTPLQDAIKGKHNRAIVLLEANHALK